MRTRAAKQQFYNICQHDDLAPPAQVWHGRPVLAVAWSPQGRTLATGCADGAVRLFDAATACLQTTVSGRSRLADRLG